MKTPQAAAPSRGRRLFLVLALAGVAALAAAVPAAAIGPGAYPPGDCRSGTPACGNGCCTKACPTGSAGVAISSGIPGLTATIKGLTYDPKTALVKGTLVATNSGTKPITSLITGLQFAPFKPSVEEYQTMSDMWCGGLKGKPLAPGASRACPFAFVGGADPAKFDFSKTLSRDPQPGVDPAALKAARAFSTSDVFQTSLLERGLKPSAISAAPQLRNTDLYPQPDDRSGGFICGFSYTPAVAAKAN